MGRGHWSTSREVAEPSCQLCSHSDFSLFSERRSRNAEMEMTAAAIPILDFSFFILTLVVKINHLRNSEPAIYHIFIAVMLLLSSVRSVRGGMDTLEGTTKRKDEKE